MVVSMARGVSCGSQEFGDRSVGACAKDTLTDFLFSMLNHLFLTHIFRVEALATLDIMVAHRHPVAAASADHQPPLATPVLPVGGRGDDPLHAPGDWHAVGRDWLHSPPSSGSQHAPLARETATAPGEAFGCGGSHQHACAYGSVRSGRLPHTEDCAAL